tara:strand:- start:646 stop:960 length:315 start_codon:yes stop_codon:yes gene_type:complete
MFNSINSLTNVNNNYLTDVTKSTENIDNISIVRSIANILPNVDKIGHQVLLNNQEIIPSILENDSIPDDIKKEIILSIIKASQYGDNFGTFLLDRYHHIADILL